MGGGQGDAEDCVGAEGALVGGAVQGKELGVDGGLVDGVLAFDFQGNHVVDVFDGAQDALAAVTLVVVVAQFVGFVLAGGSAGRDDGAADSAAFEGGLDFNGGVAARVEDFARSQAGNQRHRGLPRRRRHDEWALSIRTGPDWTAGPWPYTAGEPGVANPRI